MATPGAYLLLFRLSRRLECRLSRRPIELSAGWYVYAGSALGGLEGRLGRHLRTHSVRHWHVDWLLTHARLVDIQTLAGAEPESECRLAGNVRSWNGGKTVPAFGAGDCSCRSHLTRFSSRPGGCVRAPAFLHWIDSAFSALSVRYSDYTETARDPFRTLVTCILSLRTQDPVTHAAAERLFEQVRGPQAFMSACPERLAEWIYPVGMYRQKARRLVEIARLLVEDFGGTVPADVEVLTSLPGVGRKTANLVRSFAFNLPAVCVDTHVHRICNRWGLVRTATPDETELELRSVLPERYWMCINPYLVQHGQQVCRPRRPGCSACTLRAWCQYPRVRRSMLLAERIPGAPGHPSLRAAEPG